MTTIYYKIRHWDFITFDLTYMLFMLFLYVFKRLYKALQYAKYKLDIKPHIQIKKNYSLNLLRSQKQLIILGGYKFEISLSCALSEYFI